MKRRWFTQRSTIGELYVDGQKQCFTLEPVTGGDDRKPRAIPLGTYDLTIRYSPKHLRLVPHIESVPYFSEIEIHIGNWPKDTAGCVLVGKRRSEDWVGESTEAFEALFAKLNARPADEAMTISFFAER